MPLPKSKVELLNNLHNAYKKLDAEFDVVSSVMERDTTMQGNLSCCDILAYQMGWAHLLLSWDSTELKGQTPVMPAKGYKWNELGRLAQSFYDNASSKNLQQLRAEFKTLLNDLTLWIESLCDDELFKLNQRQWAGDKWPLVKWIQVNTIAPYRSARTKVRRWKKYNKLQ